VAAIFASAALAAGTPPSTVGATPHEPAATSAGRPLDTVAMLERHAEDLETEGRKTDAAKLRDRIAKIRDKHDIVG
jgi:hypothetical protein